MDRAKSADRRRSPRFDKAFPVFLSGERGITCGVARNIGEGGMYVEVPEVERIGSVVTVTFVWPGSGAEISVEAEVRYSAALNVGDREGRPRGVCGMGLRFLRFLLQDLYARGAPEASTMH